MESTEYAKSDDKVLAYLLDGIRAMGLAVFVDVNLHGLVTTIWNDVDYTNLKNRGSIVLSSTRLSVQLILIPSWVGER